MSRTHLRGYVYLLASMVSLLLGCSATSPPSGHVALDESPNAVIVQGNDLETVVEAVRRVGGEIIHELGIIDAVGARLTPAQQRVLEKLEGGYRVYADRLVETSGGGNGGGGSSPGTHTLLVAADQLHDEDIDGGGVTVAVIDTGLFNQPDLTDNPSHQTRVLAWYDAILDQMMPYANNDESGHGTHVSSVIVNSNFEGNKRNRSYYGIAPYADLVSIRAFDRDGHRRPDAP